MPIDLRECDLVCAKGRHGLERWRLGTVPEDVNETILQFLGVDGGRKFGDTSVAEEEGDWHGEPIIAMAVGVRCSLLNTGKSPTGFGPTLMLQPRVCARSSDTRAEAP